MLRVLSNQKVRTYDATDPYGSGEYGASRDGGERLHNGIDLIALPGVPVYSPFAGKITYKNKAYSDDSRFDTLHITNTDGDIRVKLLYVKSSLNEGDEVFSNQVVGSVQDLSPKYRGIKNHLHVELYINGIAQDPTPYFTGRIIKENRILFNSKKTQAKKLSSITYIGEDGILVEDLLKTPEFSSIGISENDFLELSHKGRSNNQRIYEQLSDSQKTGEFSQTEKYLVNTGTTFYIPRRSITVDREYFANITSTKIIDPTYLPAMVREITNSPSYRKDDVTLISPTVTVIVWSKTLNDFIDVSEHIVRCSTDSNMNGGDFSFEVSEISTEYNDGWEIGERLSSTSVNSSTSEEFINSKFYYEKTLQQNDLVLIQFEKLGIDVETVKPSGRWYDMIGLVDAVSIGVNSVSNTVNITVRGRDLAKVMIDDNSYFNPYSIGHSNSIFGGDFGDRMLDGSFAETSAFLARTIFQNIEFIVNRIASLEYIQEEAFREWADKTIFYKSTATSGNGLEANEAVNVESRGIWSIIKIFVDENIQDLRLVDDSVSNPQGSIWELFSKTAQTPFIEYFGDTYGDQFHVIFREPPFTRRAVEKAVFNQEEFVGPLQEGVDVSEIKTISVSTETPKVISISSRDVISENLSNNTESYAWYKLSDRGNFAGNTVTLGTSPNLYIPKYANIFGNKIYEVTSNYSNYKFFEYANSERDIDLYAEQQSQHLAFMVETTMYLPFTRRGTLVIEGDRRIRKGNWIFYKPTREIFYVTGVNNLIFHSDQVDRRTIIQVDRGMVIDYILGEMSYFNLIDIPKLRDGVYDTITKGSVSDKFDQKSPINVNEEVFDFFINKNQFS